MFPVENGKEVKGRCRLCMSCTEDARRGYASPRCKRCPKNNIIWVTVAVILMILVLTVLLRLGLSMSGRKKQSSHQRRMILSYMQMNTLLATIGIKWPPGMLMMFDIQSAISTVGDHIVSIYISFLLQSETAEGSWRARFRIRLCEGASLTLFFTLQSWRSGGWPPPGGHLPAAVPGGGSFPPIRRGVQC